MPPDTAEDNPDAHSANTTGQHGDARGQYTEHREMRL
jgi:hypothetical protein